MTKISERARRLFKPREKFLVLEITPRGASALFLSVDEDRNLIFEKSAGGINLKKFLKSPIRSVSQKSWEGRYLFKSRRKVIVAADSSVATTIPIPLELHRERSKVKEEVTVDELENLIAQAMAKIFNQCRGEASKRLGIDDIHTILVGAKTDHFKIDGHTIMNPIGFTGKKLSLLLTLTFTSRETFEDLRQFFNSPEEFFFMEAPHARLVSISRVRRLPLNLIVADGNDQLSLFVLQKAKDQYPVLYRERLAWSFGALFRRVAGELKVTEKTAEELYLSYRTGTMSLGATRAFKKTIQPAVDELLKEIERAKITGFVYVDASYPLPFDFPYKYRGATFEHIPISEILLGLDFRETVDGYDGLPHVLSRHLSPFLEAYFTKSNSEINQKLRRRLHWLTE